MRFDIRYRTSFVYDELVRESQNELRACPVTDDNQQVLAYRVVTQPPASIVSFSDYWGTRVDAFGVREPHVTLEVVAEATVETRDRGLVAGSPRRHQLNEPEFVDRHREHLERTAHVDWGEAIADTADRLAEQVGDDVVGLTLAIHRFVHTSLRYEPGSTWVGIEVNEVLDAGRGVCQDYAHLAIALCRAAGVPARYVSGYFFAVDEWTGADSEDDVIEAQTHAWFEAAVPGYGWLPLDPTNALPVGPRHVKIGHGRDYDDVPPLRGAYLGGGQAAVTAMVEMRRLAAAVQQQQ